MVCVVKQWNPGLPLVRLRSLTAGLLIGFLLALVGTANFPSALAATPAPAPDQGNPSLEVPGVTLSLATVRYFEACFKAISSQCRSTILVEGVPLNATLTDKQITALRDSMALDKPAPLTLPVITAIADAYKYDVERTDDHTLLLRKQYKDPEDLPCVTLGEIVHALKEIDSIGTTVSPEGSPNRMMLEVRFADSLSDAQLATAHNGMPISALTPEQQQMAISVAGDIWLGSRMQSLRALLRELTHLNEPSSRFEWMEFGGIRSFGYEGPFGDAQEKHFEAMDLYYYPAVRRLLALTLPIVPTPQSTPAAIDTMNPEVLRLIAICRLAGTSMGEIDRLLKLQVPSIMSDPTSMYVLVYKKDNHMAISFGPGPMDANGRFFCPISEGITNPPKLGSPVLRN